MNIDNELIPPDLGFDPLAPCTPVRDQGTHATPTYHSQLSTSLAIYNYW